MHENRAQTEGIGLAQAIEEVRAELEAAQEAGGGEQLRFRLGEVTLQFTVEFSKEGGAEAGVKLWVVNVGASGTVGSTRSHQVTVTLLPQQQTPEGELTDVLVSDAVGSRPSAGTRPGPTADA